MCSWAHHASQEQLLLGQMRSSHLNSQGVPVQDPPPRAPLPHGPAGTCTYLSSGKCQGAASHTRDQILNSHTARSSAHPQAQHSINGLYMSLEVHGGDQTFPWNITLQERKKALPCFLKWPCSASLLESWGRDVFSSICLLLLYLGKFILCSGKKPNPGKTTDNT